MKTLFVGILVLLFGWYGNHDFLLGLGLGVVICGLAFTIQDNGRLKP